MLGFRHKRILEPHYQRQPEERKKRVGSPVSNFVRCGPLVVRTSPFRDDLQLQGTNVSAVSRWDRLLVFSACNLGALACFAICFILWVPLMAKPRKFAILYVYFLFPDD